MQKTLKPCIWVKDVILNSKTKWQHILEAALQVAALLLLDFPTKLIRNMLHFLAKLTLHPVIELFFKYRITIILYRRVKGLSYFLDMRIFFFFLPSPFDRKMATRDARASKNHWLLCAFSKIQHYFTWSCSEFLFHPSSWLSSNYKQRIS